MKLQFSKGQRFGWLTIVEQAGKDKARNVLWRCVCECGNETIVRASFLKSGETKSCGCLKKVRPTRPVKPVKRSYSRTRLYRIWYGIIRRTEDDTRKEYTNCGGQGIKMCQEWREDFLAFRRWALNHRYKDGLSICRRDKTADFTPKNCFWATTAELRKTGYAHR